MPGLAALPYLDEMSKSKSASDRAVFVRVFGDYVMFLGRPGEAAPSDWRGAFAKCLAAARPDERAHYLAAVDQFARASTESGSAGIEIPPPAEETISEPQAPPMSASAMDRSGPGREDVDRVIEEGDGAALIALVSNPRVRLRAEHCAAIVTRARGMLDSTGDGTLARAILARTPVRKELAPLFLEATSDQRWLIVLAEQRAELGRRPAGAVATVGRETIAQLEYAAIAGEFEQFNDLLGRAIGATSELAARIANDPTGEPLAVALVAIGAPTEACVRILTASDMHERGDFLRIHTLGRLSGELSPFLAKRIVAAFVGGRPDFPISSSPLPAPGPRHTRTFSERAATRGDLPALLQPRKASTVGAK